MPLYVHRRMEREGLLESHRLSRVSTVESSVSGFSLLLLIITPPLEGAQSEVVRAISRSRQRVLSQSEVIRAILLEDSPCCGVAHRRRRPFAGGEALPPRFGATGSGTVAMSMALTAATCSAASAASCGRARETELP